jgi:AcrR family transcriptional regulator
MPKASTPHHLALTALKLAAAKPWAAVTLADIAKSAKMPLDQIKNQVVNKNALLPLIIRALDAEAAKHKIDAAGTPHDRLFDALMAVFESMQPHRAGILSLAAAAQKDPALLRAIGGAEAERMRDVLDRAGLDHRGWRGAAAAAGLLTVYAFAFCRWRRDASHDLAPTMAALDRALRRAAALAGLIFVKERPLT